MHFYRSYEFFHAVAVSQYPLSGVWLNHYDAAVWIINQITHLYSWIEQENVHTNLGVQFNLRMILWENEGVCCHASSSVKWSCNRGQSNNILANTNNHIIYQQMWIQRLYLCGCYYWSFFRGLNKIYITQKKLWGYGIIFWPV